jgi:hypothetical protein
LKVAAYSDLGGLGTKQGPAAHFVWTMPNLLPLLLPWLVVLALLALPLNRNGRAWWIWAPLVTLALIGAGLEAAAQAANNDELSDVVQAVCVTSFGLGAIWLLAASLARRCRALSLVLVALAFAAVSLLAFAVSPVSEQVWDLRQLVPAVLLYLLLSAVATGLVFAGALNLTGWLCRKRFSRWRVSLLLPLWLWVMWLLSGGVLGCVGSLGFGESFEWVALLMLSLVLALVSYGMIFPFLILSFTSSFYRERLKDLLRLPATEPSPPLPIPSSVVEVESPR